MYRHRLHIWIRAVLHRGRFSALPSLIFTSKTTYMYNYFILWIRKVHIIFHFVSIPISFSDLCLLSLNRSLRCFGYFQWIVSQSCDGHNGTWLVTVQVYCPVRPSYGQDNMVPAEWLQAKILKMARNWNGKSIGKLFNLYIEFPLFDVVWTTPYNISTRSSCIEVCVGQYYVLSIALYSIINIIFNHFLVVSGQFGRKPI